MVESDQEPMVPVASRRGRRRAAAALRAQKALEAELEAQTTLAEDEPSDVADGTSSDAKEVKVEESEEAEAWPRMRLTTRCEGLLFKSMEYIDLNGI